jgi:tetratricopeptide (TPR) repeat protein
MYKKILFILLINTTLLSTDTEERTVLFNTLSPSSISEHLSFYKLYPNSNEGKKALEHVQQLLFSTQKIDLSHSINLNTIIELTNPNIDHSQIDLSSENLKLINQLAQSLPNRSLKGYNATSIQEVLSLPTEEIDLSKALLLTLPSTKNKDNYLAILDLIALQIQAQLPQKATPEEIINAINFIIFEKLHYQFPPQSKWIKNIDIFTFLPSVMDSRKGVCLGISTLYICLAQRLNLKLEMITPPGHIFVRYHSTTENINIETTARGIHIPSDEYLSLNTKKLQIRTEKEVIGLTFFNQASVYLQKEEYTKAVNTYKKAELFLTNDPLLTEFLALSYILQGNTEQGSALLKNNTHSDYLIYPSTLSEDYLQGNIDTEGIKILFSSVNNTRQSLINKKHSLEKVLIKYPNYREGIFQLAITWLQLGRKKEAIEQLEYYHSIDPENPTTEYYLSLLYLKQFNYKKAWLHLKQTEKIEKKGNHSPRALKVLKKELLLKSPD